ncbi:MAG TPA: hypothetical protein VE715_16740, partial [Blastocatellia bacterium]|nr:hypothetical protein [Blastocatellia bacterium]
MAAAQYDAEALPSGGAYQFSNPAQGLRATCTSSGARVVATKGKRDCEMDIKLIGYGYGSQMVGLESRNIVASRNRIEHKYSSEKMYRGLSNLRMARLMSSSIDAEMLDDEASAGWTTYG